MASMTAKSSAQLDAAQLDAEIADIVAKIPHVLKDYEESERVWNEFAEAQSDLIERARSLAMQSSADRPDVQRKLAVAARLPRGARGAATKAIAIFVQMLTEEGIACPRLDAALVLLR